MKNNCDCIIHSGADFLPLLEANQIIELLHRLKIRIVVYNLHSIAIVLPESDDEVQISRCNCSRTSSIRLQKPKQTLVKTIQENLSESAECNFHNEMNKQSSNEISLDVIA